MAIALSTPITLLLTAKDLFILLLTSTDLPTPVAPPMLFEASRGGACFLRGYLSGPRVRQLTAVDAAIEISRAVAAGVGGAIFVEGTTLF